MTALTSTIVSTPVAQPGGFKLAKGTLTIDTNTYATGGFQTGVTQWTGGDVTLPARFPDFVLFSGGQEGVAATSSIEPINYNGKGIVTIYGTALTDDVGITEEAAEAMSAATWVFLAIWVNSDGPAAVSTALLSTL